jgi:hypothetical protein
MDAYSFHIYLLILCTTCKKYTKTVRDHRAPTEQAFKVQRSKAARHISVLSPETVFGRLSHIQGGGYMNGETGKDSDGTVTAKL